MHLFVTSTQCVMRPLRCTSSTLDVRPLKCAPSNLDRLDLALLGGSRRSRHIYRYKQRGPGSLQRFIIDLGGSRGKVTSFQV